MAEMIDISILNVDKYLTSDSKIDNFLYDNVEIEQKSDGIKLSLIKIDNTGTLNDWVVSYKNQIMYSNEFDYAPDYKIKKNSISNSQFKIVFDHLKTVLNNNIPINTELFIEFLIKKPTLSSNYTKHGMILLASSKVSYKIEFGKIKTSGGTFDTSKREKYAKELKLNVPVKLFSGQLANFERGILNSELKSEYNKIKNSLNIENTQDYISKIKSLFLSIDSKYGGKEEGVVLTFKNIILKWQQSYQTDQVLRSQIKDKFKENLELEDQYWKNVRLSALNILNNLKLSQDINKNLSLISDEIKNLKLDFSHSKKNDFQIKDDIQITTKNIMLKNLKGNNNALFQGKMRVLTNAHYNIIKNAIKKYDGVVICLISNKETLKYRNLRLKMLDLAFGNNPKVEIIEHSNGNIFSILRKSTKNVNIVLCGTDRYNDYKNLLIKAPDIKVVETPRNSSDISATKIIENIDNFLFFKRNTPKEIHSLYDEIKENFKNSNI